ncbi:MAG TPA: DUF4382 domain-containing protein [Nitrospiria bacterium]|jgi:hypothetical protein
MTACGSDSGNGGGIGSTGKVAILITDGPAPEFIQVNVTINEVTLLSDDKPPVNLFVGERRIDLLKLQGDDDLFVVGWVRTGFYNKIRLRISDPELITPEKKISGSDIQLVANGKLDLVLKNGLYIGDGETSVIHLDLDAEKSIHIHKTGSGKYKFRPVVFVKVLHGFDTLPRFVAVEGTIDSIHDHFFTIQRDSPFFKDSEDGVSSSDEDSFSMDKGFFDDDSGSDDSDRNHLIDVAVTGDTQIFLADGLPGNFGSLKTGEKVVARGLLDRNEELGLHIQAKLIQIGDVLRLYGVITEEIPSNGSGDQPEEFKFSLDAGQRVSGELLVRIYPETRIIEVGTHRLLGPDELKKGKRLIIEGVIDLGQEPDLFQAALIIVKPSVVDPNQIKGIIEDIPDDPSDPGYGNRTFDLLEEKQHCTPSGCSEITQIVPVHVIEDAVILPSTI